MFTAQMLRRNFSLFNRVPYGRIVRSAARDGYETITIHRVHISRPLVSKSRIISAVAVATAFYGLSWYVSLEVEIEQVVGKGQESARPDGQWTKVGGQDDDDTVALLFLPTGFAREKKKTFYKGSDPEWQEFKKIASDRARAERIRKELIKITRMASAKTASLRAHIGAVDTSKGKAWVELTFPDGPPVEYERSGIELTDDLEWRKVTRPVADAHQKRLSSLLLPKNAANAVYQDITRKAALSWRNFKLYSGWSEKPESEKVQSMVQGMTAGGDAKAGTGPTSISTGTSAAAAAAAATDSKQPAETPSSLSSQAKELGFILPDPKQLTLDLKQFRQDFRKGSKELSTQPPRGTVVVKGLIEVYGEKARLTWQVVGCYDPKISRYVKLDMALFNVIPHKQSPRG
ncbi:hypothetical protein BDU57DRAFT_458317 [Ampelomyces quisqualis]|uniref:Uncharacterized protein n=1 Tax=Ampelomyces quisqualis TaxID=50730 RepID=A0A6A5QAB0_AMPQU|nr:hypothetical protein BDU57DRAFT_458317 [Ampelomyces quisqualis]